MNRSAPGLPVNHQLPKFTQTHVHRVSDAIQPSHPLLSPLHMRWPKYWSFSFSIIPSKEIPGLISFTMDWLDLFALQGALKSLLQQHSSKASILWHSAFFTVQLSHPYMTTGRTIALTRWTFVGKVMSLLFNMLPRLVIIFLPRSKSLFFLIFIFTLFYFTILYWFWHTLTWICHRCTWVSKHEPPSCLPSHIISLDHPRAPAPSKLYARQQKRHRCVEWTFGLWGRGRGSDD